MSRPQALQDPRAQFSLAELGAYSFLNHGSFGACPRPVQEEQARIRARMEAQPDLFFRNEVMPRALGTSGEGARSGLREAAALAAEFIGAPSEQVAFVENATLGVQCALRSVPLAPGDEVLLTNHAYTAVRLMVEKRCAEAGASVRTARIEVPVRDEAIVEAVLEALTPRVRLAILDHVTSPTAFVLPLERIVPALRARGIRVIVDGAHAIGQIPLDVATLQADWYVTNAHKWLFAPRGTAVFHASGEAAAQTRPPLVSHFVAMGFPWSFDWIGTRDYSAWLAFPAALAFWRSLDRPAAVSRQRAQLERVTRLLEPLGVQPLAPIELCAAMRSFILPQSRPAAQEDAIELMRSLWEKARVQAMAVAFEGRLLLRVSSQVYVVDGDLGRLAAALREEGWPGR